jgi:GTPase SAR1 family protein
MNIETVLFLVYTKRRTTFDFTCLTRYHDFTSNWENELRRECDGMFILYSIINRASFVRIPYIVRTVLQYNQVSWVPMVLIGTFKDLENERQVSTSEAQALAAALNCPLFELDLHDNVEIHNVQAVLDAFYFSDLDPGSGKSCNVM